MREDLQVSTGRRSTRALRTVCTAEHLYRIARVSICGVLVALLAREVTGASAVADSLLSWRVAQAPSAAGRVGGRCEYRDLPGTATITRVAKTAASSQQAGAAGYEGLEIEFSFASSQPIEDAAVRRFAERPHQLRLINSWYPGPRFVQKYGLTQGRALKAVLQIITKGTCTPMLFWFPEVDLSDYFESRH